MCMWFLWVYNVWKWCEYDQKRKSRQVKQTMNNRLVEKVCLCTIFNGTCTCVLYVILRFPFDLVYLFLPTSQLTTFPAPITLSDEMKNWTEKPVLLLYYWAGSKNSTCMIVCRSLCPSLFRKKAINNFLQVLFCEWWWWWDGKRCWYLVLHFCKNSNTCRMCFVFCAKLSLREKAVLLTLFQHFVQWRKVKNTGFTRIVWWYGVHWCM